MEVKGIERGASRVANVVVGELLASRSTRAPIACR
jgi:hypothetical protein